MILIILTLTIFVQISGLQLSDLKHIIIVNSIKVKDEEALFCYQFRNDIDFLIHIVEEKKTPTSKVKNEIIATLKLIDKELGMSY